MESSAESDFDDTKKCGAKKKSEHNKKCPVKGCKSQSKDGIRFFSFPRDTKNNKFAPLAKVWCFFTRVKNFQPKITQAMCEIHFSEMCITETKKGDCKKILRPKSVPTIYINDDGEKVELLYDPVNMDYYGDEASKIAAELKMSEQTEIKQMFCSKNKRLEEIKRLCRFCFSNESDAVLLPMTDLQKYSINPTEMLKQLGIDTYSEAFSTVICGDCFEKLISMENYRKRCQNSHSELIKEIKELERKTSQVGSTVTLLETRKDRKSTAVKNKSQNYIESDSDSNADIDFAANEDEDWIDNVINNDSSQDETPAFNKWNESQDVAIKNEPEWNCPEFIDPTQCNEEQETEEPTRRRKRAKTEEPTRRRKRAKTEEDSTEKAVKIKRCRNFECFFCRLKFVGLKTFKTHICTTKNVECPIDECDMYFNSQSGYNSHILHRHNLPKVAKHFCPVCVTCYQMNAVDFDEHCKKCVKVNEYKEQKIQCKECKKICDSLQSYTAHKMLHGTKNVILDTNGKPKPITRPKRGKEEKICDICGKTFDTSGLQRHKLNVHFVNFTGQMFYCDLCPIAKPTKRLLYNHMKGTHIIRWHRCEICLKNFRNRELWKKHQLIHGDFKKNNRCDVCPHQPGFVTQSALRKHMRTNHGGDQPIRKYTCDICRASYTRDDLLIRHRFSVHKIMHNNYTSEIISQYIKY